MLGSPSFDTFGLASFLPQKVKRPKAKVSLGSSVYFVHWYETGQLGSVCRGLTLSAAVALVPSLVWEKFYPC